MRGTVWAPWIAAAASLLFTGGALYVSFVEHPARLACGPPMALAQFRTSYPRGTRLQAPLAALACLGGIGAWLGGAPAGWLAAGVTVGLVIPYTLAGILPTNRRLLDPGLEPDSPEAHRLLRRWGYLHLLRTVLGVVGSGWMLRLLAAG
jgi:Anthrone oxygenase